MSTGNGDEVVYQNPTFDVDESGAAAESRADGTSGKSQLIRAHSSMMLSSDDTHDILFMTLNERTQDNGVAGSFILDPEGPFRRVWDTAVLCLVIYSSAWEPYKAAFLESVANTAPSFSFTKCRRRARVLSRSCPAPPSVN